jgi:hypothetical protein
MYYVLRDLLSIPRFSREATVVYKYEEAVVYLAFVTRIPPINDRAGQRRMFIY